MRTRLCSPDLVLESLGGPRDLPVFSLCWNPQDGCSNSNKGMAQQDQWTCQLERGQPSEQKILSSLPVLLHGLPAGVMDQILGGGSPDLKGFRFRVGLPPQMTQRRSISHRYAQMFGI